MDTISMLPTCFLAPSVPLLGGIQEDNAPYFCLVLNF